MSTFLSVWPNRGSNFLCASKNYFYRAAYETRTKGDVTPPAQRWNVTGIGNYESIVAFKNFYLSQKVLVLFVAEPMMPNAIRDNFFGDHFGLPNFYFP